MLHDVRARIYLSLLLLSGGAAALRAQTLSALPSSGFPTGTVVLRGSGFLRGPANLSWDRPLIIRRFRVAPDGGFEIVYQIPEGAAPGDHVVSVANVGGGRRASTVVTVQAESRPSGRFDLHVRAVEVTQGVRGDVRRRLSPGASLDLTDEGVVHVAGRRTIVRVYPAVDAPAGVTLPTVTARLYGFGDGSLLAQSPILPRGGGFSPRFPEPGLEGLRDDASLSWNFVLPDRWTGLGTRLELVVDVNSGREPECTGCFGNNVVTYRSVHFHRVERDPYVPLPGAGETRAPLVIVPYLVTHRCREPATGVTRTFTPTTSDLAAALAEIRRLFPLAEGAAGMVVVPAGTELFETDGCGPITGGQKDRFKNQVRRRFFPGRSLRGDPLGVVRLFLFAGATPLLQGGWAKYHTSFATADTGTYTSAHEVAHTFGLHHAGNRHCAGDRNRDYPDPHGQVEAQSFGFNRDTLAAVGPNVGRILGPTDGVALCHGHRLGLEERTHDYMAGGPPPPWTSLYTWRWMAEALGSRRVDARGSDRVIVPVRAPAGASSALSSAEYLVFNGSLDRRGGVELEPALLSGPPVRAVPVAQEDPEGYILALRGEDGELLALQPLVLERDTERPRGKDRFTAVVAAPRGWRSVAVARGQDELLTLRRSSHAPEIAIRSPRDGAQWPAEGQAFVTWRAADADGDTLTFQVEGSPDGETWLPLPAEAGKRGAAVDLAAIPGGGWQPGWVRVQASDGLHVTASPPVTVHLAPKPPRPYVLSSAVGRCFAPGEPIELAGQAGDWQEGPIPVERLTWWLDGQAVGSGESASLARLAAGEYVVLLRATNRHGLAGEATLLIAVDRRQACVRPAAEPTVAEIRDGDRHQRRLAGRSRGRAALRARRRRQRHPAGDGAARLPQGHAPAGRVAVRLLPPGDGGAGDVGPRDAPRRRAGDLHRLRRRQLGRHPAGTVHRGGAVKRAVVLIVLAAGVLALWVRAQTPAPPRNMIVILSDDHRYDFMSFHPDAPAFLATPGMDRMAAAGAHVANAFVTTSLCSPSCRRPGGGPLTSASGTWARTSTTGGLATGSGIRRNSTTSSATRANGTT